MKWEDWVLAGLVVLALVVVGVCGFIMFMAKAMAD